MNPIVFFDDDCGLCSKAVAFFLRRDKNALFRFAPLQGVTAHKELKDFEPYQWLDSIILLEKGAKPSYFYWSQAIFRMLWLIGGIWSIPGLLSFLPRPLLWPFDVGYRFIAKYRKKLCLTSSQQEMWKQYQSRFLP
jgi:predicted DCC family thiol-disulfide oxidoreductase YuxK